MRESRPVVVAPRGEKNLRLVLEASEGFRMDNPVPVPLEACPDFSFFFWLRSPPALRAETGFGMKSFPLDLFCLFPNRRGIIHINFRNTCLFEAHSLIIMQ
jgi:hypothetical protein